PPRLKPRHRPPLPPLPSARPPSSPSASVTASLTPANTPSRSSWAVVASFALPPPSTPRPCASSWPPWSSPRADPLGYHPDLFLHPPRRHAQTLRRPSRPRRPVLPPRPPVRPPLRLPQSQRRPPQAALLGPRRPGHLVQTPRARCLPHAGACRRRPQR